MAYYTFPPPFYSSSNPQFYSPSATIPAPLPNLIFSHGYTPPSPNPYTPSNLYCYGNAESSGYYNTYKQQPTHPYSQYEEATQYSEMAISIFDGDEDAYGWVLCTEKHFKMQCTPEKAKVTEAVLALQGRALHWWLWWSHRHPEASWNTFTTALLWRFKPEWRPILPLLDEEEDPDSKSLNSAETPSLNNDSIADPPSASINEQRDMDPPSFLREAHLCFPSTEPSPSQTEITVDSLAGSVAAFVTPLPERYSKNCGFNSYDNPATEPTINTNPYDPGLITPQPPDRISAQPSTPPPPPKPPDPSFQRDYSTIPPPLPHQNRPLFPSAEYRDTLLPLDQQWSSENSSMPFISHQSCDKPITPPTNPTGSIEAPYAFLVPLDQHIVAEYKSQMPIESTIHMSPLQATKICQVYHSDSPKKLIAPSIANGTASQLFPSCINSKITLNAPVMFPSVTSIAAYPDAFSNTSFQPLDQHPNQSEPLIHNSLCVTQLKSTAAQNVASSDPSHPRSVTVPTACSINSCAFDTIYGPAGMKHIWEPPDSIGNQSQSSTKSTICAFPCDWPVATHTDPRAISPAFDISQLPLDHTLSSMRVKSTRQSLAHAAVSLEMSPSGLIQLINRPKVTLDFIQCYFDHRMCIDVFAYIIGPTVDALSPFLKHVDEEELLLECIAGVFLVPPIAQSGLDNTLDGFTTSLYKCLTLPNPYACFDNFSRCLKDQCIAALIQWQGLILAAIPCENCEYWKNSCNLEDKVGLHGANNITIHAIWVQCLLAKMFHNERTIDDIESVETMGFFDAFEGKLMQKGKQHPMRIEPLFLNTELGRFVCGPVPPSSIYDYIPIWNSTDMKNGKKRLHAFEGEFMQKGKQHPMLIFWLSIGKWQQWDPGGELDKSTTSRFSPFKQWDPGKFAQATSTTLRTRLS